MTLVPIDGKIDKIKLKRKYSRNLLASLKDSENHFHDDTFFRTFARNVRNRMLQLQKLLTKKRSE